MKPESVAQLKVGMKFPLHFLCERGSFAEDWCNGIADRFQKILFYLAVKQAESIDEDKPTHVFIRKIFTLLESSQAYLINRNNVDELGFGTCIGDSDSKFTVNIYPNRPK